MAKQVENEFYCRACGHETVSEQRMYECPECGGSDVCNSGFLTCFCGEKIYLARFTKECGNCGRLYNPFGQELAPREEWDPEGKY